MKKKLLSVGLCLTMAMPMALAACGSTDGNNNALPSPNDVYGMGAVSSVRLLGSGMPAGAVKTFSAVNAAVQSRTCGEVSAYTVTEDAEQEVKEQTERFNEYFTALDSFLGEDIVSTETQANTDSNYEYDTKMTVTGKDFNGDTVIYTMYYTETPTVTETDDEEGETENEYRLEGIMSIDGVEYSLEGERSEETEKDETETELKIRAYADITDKTTYIQMEQERSEEEGELETEYVYSVYANGELVEQTAVEFEKENKNNKTETEYELEFRSGATKGKYLLEREEKGDRTAIKVKYEIDGRKGVFHIREITDAAGNKKYEYSYSDGSKQLFDRSFD